MGLSAARKQAVDRAIRAIDHPSHGPGTVAAMQASEKQTHAWAKESGYKPRPSATIAAAPIHVRRPLNRKGSGNVKLGLGVVANLGALRTIGHAAEGVAGAIYHDPIASAQKTAKQATEIAKGLPAAAAVVPYSIAYPINRALGNDPGDNPLHMAKRMIDQEAHRLSKTYGPSYRGEKGSGAKLRQQIRHEGPLTAALDLSTVVAPLSAGAGAAARTVAATTGGRVAERVAGATLRRAPVRHGITDASVKARKARRGLVGAAGQQATDAARRGAQAAARARATKRLRVRAAERVGLHIARTAREGDKPSLLNTVPRPLAPHRAAVREGEVAPLLSSTGARAARLRVATEFTRGEARARARVAQHVNGRKGDTFHRDMHTLAPEDRPVAVLMHRYGIRDSAGAVQVLDAKIAEIERGRADALAGAGKHGKDDAAAESHAQRTGEGADNLAWFKELRAHPEVFDQPELRAVVERQAARGRVVGEREGLSAERAARGRADLQGATFGVKTAKAVREEHKAAKLQAKAEAKTELRVAVREREKVRATSARVLAGARADLEHAKGRAEVLDRNVTGRNTPTRIDGKRAYAGGALGVHEAERALEAAKGAAGEALSRATLRVKEARQAHKEAAQRPLPAKGESGAAYEARVAAAMAERGLAAPEYTPSKYLEHDDGLHVSHPNSDRPANPLNAARSGTLSRIGREDFSPDHVQHNLEANLKRGARLEAESRILEQHGLRFADKDEAARFIRGLGADSRQFDVVAPSVAAKHLVEPRRTKGGAPKAGADAGDYWKTADVFLVPRYVKQELDALRADATKPASILRKLGSRPQAALLALSPSWWMFQRVNDIVGMVAGGSLLSTRAAHEAIKGLSPEDREIAQVMSGGAVSSQFLSPASGRQLGRMQRVLDENPTYRDALNSDKPATNLLIKAGHDAPTALLRTDQAITAGVRERQFVHSLSEFAAKADPEVKAIMKAYGPLGTAFKTADSDLLHKLLTDPKFEKQREDAATRLNDVMGDWSNYTARERKFRNAFAFYGFLRFATHMAFYTLPVKHPLVGLLVARLGLMGAEDAKAIIGPDLPYGLGALYNDDGTAAFDLTRANPITGPLLSITKPEQLWSLGTPLASIMASYAVGQPIGLSDSATGYVKQFSVKGDENDHAVGGFLGEPRLRILGDSVLSLLTPYKEWKKYDLRPQSSDSLPWDRRYLQSETPAGALRLQERAKTSGKGGLGTLAHDLLPLVVPSDGKNVKAQGQVLTAGRKSREDAATLKRAKRTYALDTPQGRLDLKLKVLDERLAAQQDALTPAGIKALDQKLKLLDAKLGIGG